MSLASAAEGVQHPQPISSRSGTFMRDEQMDSMNYQYYSQAYRSQGMFVPLQAPEQQNTLRHRQSSSNDALRAFGPGSQSLADGNVQHSAPQELYSTASSNAHDPFQFSRNPNSQEFDFASNPMQSSNLSMNGPIMSLNHPPQSQVPPQISNSSNSAPFSIVPPQTTSFSNSSVMSSHPSHATGPAPLPTSPGIASPTSSSIIPQQLMQMFPSHLPSGIQVQPNPRSHQPPPLPGAQQNPQLPHLMQNLSLGVNPQSKGTNLSAPMGMAPGPPVAPQSGSGQTQGLPQEEISTIFVVGFPDDMTEREFQNMFTFCSGYEAATLKVPTKEPVVQPPQNPAVAAAASALAGASDPYNLVTVNSGGVVVDQGNNTAATTSSMWATGLEDPYTRHVLAAAAASSNTSTSELAQQIALAQQNQPRKQIIGFAKFRTREDALKAKDVLHGKKVDVEKNAQLKAEMAKKNLHTKRGVGPLPAGAGPNGPQPGMTADNMGPVSVFGSGSMLNAAVPGPGNILSQPPQAAMQMLPGDQSLNGPPRGLGASPNDSLQNPQQQGPKLADSPTLKHQRVNDIPPFIPSGGVLGNYPSTDITSFYPPAFHRNEPPQLPSSMMPPHGNPPEGFHALPNKPVSDIVKANALPPTNLPPPTLPPLIIGQPKPTLFQRDSPPSLSNPPGSDAGYISDAPSMSRRSQRSRSTSISRYGGRTPSPFQDESHAHIPSHLLQDLGTPQQTDFPSKRLEDLPIGQPENANAQSFSPNFNGPAGVVGSSASSNAGSVSSGGAESMSTSTTSGNGGNGKHENIHHAPSTIASRRGVINGATVDLPRNSQEHRGRSNAADQNPPINTLYVGNLPTSMPNAQSSKLLEDALNNLFATCQGYRKLSFKQKNNGTMCFVEFEDVASASKALNDLYGNTLNGLVKGGGIRLSYSKNPLGVRTSAPNSSSSSNGITSPIHSPTSHNPIQFGNVPPNMQEPFSPGRPGMVNPMAKPLDMPRGRPRQDTGELMVGIGSPPARFGPSSPPQTTPVTAGFNAPNKLHSTYGRNPNVPGGQHYMTASSPPVTSPISISYQPSSTFQPFVKPDMTRDLGRTSQDSDPNA